MTLSTPPRTSRGGTVAGVNTWFDYRSVWAAHPWVLIYAVFVVLLFVVSIIGTIMGSVLAILFIPSLAGVYLHHLIVVRKLEQRGT